VKSTVVIVNSRFLQRPQKPKSPEPAYSQTLNQNISIDSGSRSRKSCIHTVIRLWWTVFQWGREVWRRG